MDSWILPSPCEGISLTIEPIGVCLRSQIGSSADFTTLISAPAKTRLGRLLPSLVPQLSELGLVTIEETGLIIPHFSFADLEDYGIDAFDETVRWSPFTVEMESSGSLGFES